MERDVGEWDREMTAGRTQTRVPAGVQARIWSGLLLAPQCPLLFFFILALPIQTFVSQPFGPLRHALSIHQFLSPPPVSLSLQWVSV